MKTVLLILLLTTGCFLDYQTPIIRKYIVEKVDYGHRREDKKLEIGTWLITRKSRSSSSIESIHISGIISGCRNLKNGTITAEFGDIGRSDFALTKPVTSTFMEGEFPNQWQFSVITYGQTIYGDKILVRLSIEKNPDSKCPNSEIEKYFEITEISITDTRLVGTIIK